MTQDQTKEAILRLKLPPDRLDNFWNLFLGQTPTAIPFCGAIWAVIVNAHLLSMMWFIIFFLLTLILQAISLYFLLTDRKLKTIKTGLNKIANDQIVEESLKYLKWKVNKLPYVYDCDIPFAFGQNGYLLKILTNENAIYFNVRNIGTYKGRMPFMFGLETLKGNKFKKQIKLHAIKYLNQK